MKNKHIIINTEELQYYLKDIKKIPVISHERQDEIFKLFDDKSLDENEKNKLREELVLGNLRFVISVAKSYQNQGLDLLDLISEGNMGLLKAMERFNHKNGVKFISYAVWWIKQTILSSLNDYARTIRIPSNLIQESQKERNLIKGDDKITAKEAMKTLPFCVSLFDNINEEGGEFIELIKDPNESNPEIILDDNEEIRHRISNILNVLDHRERVIIEKYFGLNGDESNLEDLGEEFNCTKERVRQLKDKAIKKLRNESFSFFNYL